MNVIKEEPIILYGKEYIEVTYDNGEQVLKRYNTKTKMWSILKFPNEENTDIIPELINIVKSGFRKNNYGLSKSN